MEESEGKGWRKVEGNGRGMKKEGGGTRYPDLKVEALLTV